MLYTKLFLIKILSKKYFNRSSGFRLEEDDSNDSR